MKCPICNKELKIVCETVVDINTVEVVGTCESGEYDGRWFIKKDEKENMVKEYNLKKYWHG